jgi:Tol biopolymer transport system component
MGCLKNDEIDFGNVSFDLSPDGRSVVFASAEGDLFLFDLSTKKAIRLTSTDNIESCPAFSPNGDEIVFSRGDDKGSNLFLMQLSTRKSEQITFVEGSNIKWPRFTGDGETIGFAKLDLKRRGSMGGWTWDRWNVAEIQKDGSNFRQITDVNYYGMTRVIPLGDGDFLFSADERGGNFFGALFEIQSGNERLPERIIPGKTTDDTANSWAGDPTLSRDGKYLAFVTDVQRPFYYDICICERDGSNRKYLVGSQSRYNQLPAFFPQEDKLLFLAGTEDLSLYEVTFDGKMATIASSKLFTEPDTFVNQKSVMPNKSSNERKP